MEIEPLIREYWFDRSEDEIQPKVDDLLADQKYTNTKYLLYALLCVEQSRGSKKSEYQWS